MNSNHIRFEILKYLSLTPMVTGNTFSVAKSGSTPKVSGVTKMGSAYTSDPQSLYFHSTTASASYIICWLTNNPHYHRTWICYPRILDFNFWNSRLHVQVHRSEVHQPIQDCIWVNAMETTSYFLWWEWITLWYWSFWYHDVKVNPYINNQSRKHL